VDIVLSSPVSMMLIWGPEHVLVYNSAYSLIAGDSHPSALGRTVVEVWPEQQDWYRAVFQASFSGQSLSYREQPLAFKRNGNHEEGWFDLFYSPVRDERAGLRRSVFSDRRRHKFPHPGRVSAQGNPLAGMVDGSGILIVDDNVDAANTLAMLLQANGHRVTVKHNGEDTLQHCASDAPGAMLIDIDMPGMDGYTLARKLCNLPQTANAVLIAVTGYGQAHDRQRAEEAGFTHHLVKPVDSARLLALLAGRFLPEFHSAHTKPEVQRLLVTEAV
jgi:CheY-like chemotaxis protein